MEVFHIQRCRDICELMWDLLRAKLAKDITFLECCFWWESIKRQYHAYCKTTSCVERACNLQTGCSGLRFWLRAHWLCNPGKILFEPWKYTLSEVLSFIFPTSNLGKIIPTYLRGTRGIKVLYCTVMYKMCFHYYMILDSNMRSRYQNVQGN